MAETKPKSSNWTPDLTRRCNRPFIADIADDQPPRKDVYVGTLVERFMKLAYRRLKRDRTRFQPENRFSWANLARMTGISYYRIQCYFIRRRTPMDIESLDKCLWAMKLSVLDLIEPHEILSYIQAMDEADIEALRLPVRRMLDKIRKASYSTTSTDSSQNAPESDENEQV